MAGRPWKPCAHPGCRALTLDTYCPNHQPPDRHRRSAEAAQWHQLYKLPIWTKVLRPNQLAREPFCRACAERGRKTGEAWLLRVRATDVDHIIPHRGDMKLFTDPHNLQSLCHACHSRKTAAEMAAKKDSS